MNYVIKKSKEKLKKFLFARNFENNYSAYHQIITLFIGFLDVLGPETSKK